MMQAIGRYQVVRTIGAGATATVLHAHDPELDRDVAIKLIARDRLDEAGRRRFAREARVLGRLRHPHIMPIHEVGEADGTPFLVMPLLSGGSLESRIERDGPLEPREAVRIAGKLARALRAAHEAGLVHRDVKPANVLFDDDRDGAPVLADFGLVGRAADQDEAAAVVSAHLSVGGAFLGTPGYAPPEQALGQLGEIDGRSDVYGLGATLYAMLTGAPPFSASTPMEVLTAQMRGHLEPPSAHRPGVPAWLDELVLACLAPERDERLGDAEELARRLETGGPTRARRRAPPPSTNRRSRTLLLVGGLAMAVAVIAIGVSQRPTERPTSVVVPDEPELPRRSLAATDDEPDSVPEPPKPEPRPVPVPEPEPETQTETESAPARDLPPIVYDLKDRSIPGRFEVGFEGHAGWGRRRATVGAGGSIMIGLTLDRAPVRVSISGDVPNVPQKNGPRPRGCIIQIEVNGETTHERLELKRRHSLPIDGSRFREGVNTLRITRLPGGGESAYWLNQVRVVFQEEDDPK